MTAFKRIILNKSFSVNEINVMTLGYTKWIVSSVPARLVTVAVDGPRMAMFDLRNNPRPRHQLGYQYFERN